jgi:hypothetical protein
VEIQKCVITHSRYAKSALMLKAAIAAGTAAAANI